MGELLSHLLPQFPICKMGMILRANLLIDLMVLCWWSHELMNKQDIGNFKALQIYSVNPHLEYKSLWLFCCLTLLVSSGTFQPRLSYYIFHTAVQIGSSRMAGSTLDHLCWSLRSIKSFLFPSCPSDMLLTAELQVIYSGLPSRTPGKQPIYTPFQEAMLNVYQPVVQE